MMYISTARREYRKTRVGVERKKIGGPYSERGLKVTLEGVYLLVQSNTDQH